jgi:hypothetical protein
LVKHSNAPQVPYALYFGEKANFAGTLIGAILYGRFTMRPVPTPANRFIVLGIVIVLFFQCMGAFFNPANRLKGGIIWPLVAHTALMFSFVTIYTATSLDLQSISFIDNREFPGVDGLVPLGPLGYQLCIYSTAIGIVPNLMVLLNKWLTDGLLVSFSANPTPPMCLT